MCVFLSLPLRGLRRKEWREMDSTSEGAARCSSSVAAQRIIHHGQNPTTAVWAGQGRNAATAKDSGQGGRRGMMSATEASLFWRTVNVGERIEPAGGGDA